MPWPHETTCEDILGNSTSWSRVPPPCQCPGRLPGYDAMSAGQSCSRFWDCAPVTCTAEVLAALQMEDATPSLQMLRERVDAAKALRTAWLREAAAKVSSAAWAADKMLPPFHLLLT